MANYNSSLDQWCSLLTGRLQVVIPKRLVTLGQETKIELHDDLELKGKKINGCFENISNTIKLRKHLDLDRTLIHEICHLRDFLFGYKLNSSKEDCESLTKFETQFWLSVFRQLLPVADMWQDVQKKLDVGYGDNKLILLQEENLRLKEENLRLKNEIEKLTKLEKRK